ncbi:hypothetical protein LOK74_02190 [Brevibacillus humidisoli]|uniref:hypothetical protein n=1 Tax=Brevibacillus humidisoli TaxID=2895522 RepID=UPI001E3B0A6C|nr:hypothetical protein [Brevibacillus humidisoli]UFJ41369.1 hypothetical protein LOK74_02190 [Brevibacillus humidisoli]
MLQIEQVRKKIENLGETDAKSLLMIIYARLDTAINGTGGIQVVEKTMHDLFEMYKRLPDKQHQGKQS